MGLGAAAGAAVVAAGSIGSALIGSNAAKSASDAQSQSAANTLGFQEGVYNNTVANLQPFTSTGTNALSSLASLYGLSTTAGGTGNPGAAGNSTAMQAFNNYSQLPSYQFPLQQGQLATNRSLAASGLANSGGALKAMTQYGQGYASTGFNNYLSQLTNLANMGQNSAAMVGQQGNQAASTVNSANNTIGTANASGIVGSANATTNGINSLTGLLTSPSAYSSMSGNNLLGSLFGSSGTPASGASAASASEIDAAGW